MDNLYWSTKGECHFIDLELVPLNCFELLNICEANKALFEECELVRREARKEGDAPALSNKIVSLLPSTAVPLNPVEFRQIMAAVDGGGNAARPVRRKIPVYYKSA
jgi:hypothetical protein